MTEKQSLWPVDRFYVESNSSYCSSSQRSASSKKRVGDKVFQVKVGSQIGFNVLVTVVEKSYFLRLICLHDKPLEILRRRLSNAFKRGEFVFAH